MSAEEFNLQFDRASKAVRDADISPEFRERINTLLAELNRLVVVEGQYLEKATADSGNASVIEKFAESRQTALGLLQQIVVAVALEEGRRKQTAGA